MNNKSFYVVFASSLMILICLIYQGSYSYFTASVGGTGNTSNNTSTAALDELSDLVITNGNSVSSQNMLPGDSVSNTFTINNPNNIKVCYSLKWSEVENTFINQTDVVYTLKDSKGNIVADIQFPSTSATSYIKTGLALATKTTENYTITITYKNTANNQINDMGKTFKGKIIGELSNCA